MPERVLRARVIQFEAGKERRTLKASKKEAKNISAWLRYIGSIRTTQSFDPNHPKLIFRNVFIGTYISLPSVARNSQITHVLMFGETKLQDLNMTVLNIKEGAMKNNHLSVLKQLSRWMRRALVKNNTAIAILDNTGTMEAPLGAAAYLIRYENLSVKAVVARIKPIVSISWSDEELRYLLDFEKWIRSGAKSIT